MSDYERGLTAADEIVAGWIDPKQPKDMIETLQAIRADIALKIEESRKLATCNGQSLTRADCVARGMYNRHECPWK